MNVKTNKRKNYNLNGKIDLMKSFRKAWMENAIWSRFFIVSNASNLQDTQMVSKRLVKNASDISSVFRKIYGEEKAIKLERILTDHILIQIKLIGDAKQGNNPAIKDDRINWYKNIDELVELLTKININVHKNQWQTLFYNYLSIIENQVLKYFGKQYDKEIELYDELESESLKIADLMSQGIMY